MNKQRGYYNPEWSFFELFVVIAIVIGAGWLVGELVIWLFSNINIGWKK